MEQRLSPGDVVGDRFEVQQLVGSGGMGTVYCARDRVTSREAALKVLRLRGVDEGKRFAREAALLAELRHPRIVRYIDHGTTPAGDQYLAMEWLEGRPLSARLRLGPVPMDETLAIVSQAAEALGVAHRQGFIHRDVKPSNVFLIGGSPFDVKVIDFGVARRFLSGSDEGTELTKTGALVGTTAYMSPEQAEGKRDVDARADVYSLGVVLYECLTGRRAFKASSPREVLAKILLEQPPRLRDAAPELPIILDGLVAKMLSRDRWNRPVDGGAVVAEIEAIKAELGLQEEPTTSTVEPSTSSGYLTESEQRVVWVLLIDERDDGAPTRTEPLSASGVVRVQQDADATVVEGGRRSLDARSRRIGTVVESYGGKLGFTSRGMVTVAFSGAGASADEASRAARCALELRAVFGELAFSLAAGPAIGAATPQGEVLERGTGLLARAEPGTIRVDDVAAGLLEARFHLQPDRAGMRLVGERTSEPVPALLGRPTPFVGRARELATLEGVLDECIEEPVARAVVVRGAAGAGKSRLRREFTARLGEQRREVQVLLGRAAVLGTGSPFGMVGDAVRRLARIGERDPLETSRDKLRELMVGLLSEEDPRHAPTVDFLGEMVRVPFGDEGRPGLAAAREDAVLMGDSIRTAWEEFLAALCDRGPVLLVLEDVHLGDRPSINLVDSALRHLEDRPLMVLALARPEVEQRFPELWAERHAQPVRLAPLTRRAREELVRFVLGERVDEQTRAMILQRSDGNPLYLEELMRAVVRGKSDRLPESLLAMVQARLDEVDTEARRVLRAASVFGEWFWPGGVAHLLGGASLGRHVAAQLEVLERHELIERRGVGSAADRGYAFRHLLVREGAYATLTEDDRKLAHRLAGEWLEHVGESNPLVLAEHFARGEAPDRASGWLLKAAEQALEGNDLVAAVERASAALESGGNPETRATAHLVRAEALSWSGDYEAASHAGEEALRLLPAATGRWFHALGETAYAAAQLERYDDVLKWLPALRVPVREEDAAAAQVVALSRVGWLLHLSGRIETANALLDLAVSRVRGGERGMERARPWVHGAAAVRAYYRGDFARYLTESIAAAEGFAHAHDQRRACTQAANVSVGYIKLGDYESAERILRECIETAERMSLLKSIAVASQNLGYVLLELGRVDEAQRVSLRALEVARRLKASHVQGLAYKCLAAVARTDGKLVEAEDEIRQALALLEATPALQADALVELGAVLRERGDLDAVLEALEQARAIAQDLGDVRELGPGEFQLLLLLAETLEEKGESERAREVIRDAARRLAESAWKVSDPEWRRSYLERVPVHARIVELARRWDIEAAEAGGGAG